VTDNALPKKMAEAILANAAARNEALEVDLPDGDELRSLKTRFLAISGSPGERRIVIEAPRHEGVVWPVREGARLQGYFKVSEDVYSFNAAVIRRDRFQLNPTMRLPSLVITYPAALQKRQRRAHYRAVLPLATTMGVRFEPLPPGQKIWSVRRKPRYRAQARDLSAGGMGLAWTPKEGVNVKQGIVLVLHFKIPTFDDIILMNGTVQHKHPVGDNSELMGIRFTDWQESILSRRAVNEISKYVVQLEIEEIKRARGE